MLFSGNINLQKVFLKNKISTENDPSNLRNLLQQLHKMDIDPMFNILDINYEVFLQKCFNFINDTKQ